MSSEDNEYIALPGEIQSQGKYTKEFFDGVHKKPELIQVKLKPP